MRSSADGWMVTINCVPSARAIGLPRTLPMVTVLPVRLRAALTPERDDDRRPDQRSLGVEPDPAAFDLVIVGTLVQAAFAAHLVLEMLDRVGDEGLLARDAGVAQRLVQNAAGGPDKRFAG